MEPLELATRIARNPPAPGKPQRYLAPALRGLASTTSTIRLSLHLLPPSMIHLFSLSFQVPALALLHTFLLLLVAATLLAGHRRAYRKSDHRSFAATLLHLRRRRTSRKLPANLASHLHSLRILSLHNFERPPIFVALNTDLSHNLLSWWQNRGSRLHVATEERGRQTRLPGSEARFRV
jgi:hypothetical protein